MLQGVPMHAIKQQGREIKVIADDLVAPGKSSPCIHVARLVIGGQSTLGNGFFPLSEVRVPVVAVIGQVLVNAVRIVASRSLNVIGKFGIKHAAGKYDAQRNVRQPPLAQQTFDVLGHSFHFGFADAIEVRLIGQKKRRNRVAVLLNQVLVRRQRCTHVGRVLELENFVKTPRLHVFGVPLTLRVAVGGAQ